MDIKKVDDYGMFQMTYDRDYGFDDFLKVGAKNQGALEAYLDAKFNLLGPACTTFCTHNYEGDVIFGRNYDFNIYSPPLQLTTRPGGNNYASISTTSLLYLEYGVDDLPKSGDSALLASPYIPADGLNEKGVTIAVLTVAEAKPPHCESKITLPTTTAIRLVLDKADSVNEAVKLLRQYNIYFSLDITCHFHIADASGHSVIVEYWDNDIKVTESPIASNFIACKTDEIIAQGNAVERHDIAKGFIDSNKNVLNKSQAVDLLVKLGGKAADFGIGTQWSVIYNLSKLEGTIFANLNTDNLIDFSLQK